MDGDGRDDKLKAERRAFLEKCGRFALVTPPVVTLMLAVSEKTTTKALAASGPTTVTASQSSMILEEPPRPLDRSTGMIDATRLAKDV